MGGGDVFRVWAPAGISWDVGLGGNRAAVVVARALDSTVLAMGDDYGPGCGRNCRGNSGGHKGGS